MWGKMRRSGKYGGGVGKCIGVWREVKIGVGKCVEEDEE